jgi:hypothetical protein
MLGVVRCPKCKLARGVELSAATATCPSCGRELHPRKMKPICIVESVSDLPSAVQAVNLRGKEDQVPRPPPRGPKANLAQKAVAELRVPRSCAQLAEALEIDAEAAQQLLDKLAESGEVLLLRDGTYQAITPT